MNEDPLLGFKFRVDLNDGRGNVAGFMRMSETSQARGEKRWCEITDTFGGLKLPDVLDFSDVVFSGGIYIGGGSGEDWFNQASREIIKGYSGSGEPPSFRRDITIRVFEKGQLVCRQIVLKSAYPKVLKTSQLNGMASEVFIQQFTVAHEGIQMSAVAESSNRNSY